MIFITCLALLISSCRAELTGRDNEPRTVGWVSDPNGRGTSGLVISCILTLGLCVWSAMHLNIPPKGETQTQYWIRSIKWVALGILIPELVVLSAWRQWLSARKMGKELNVIFTEKESQGHPTRRHPWTITHSYYAGMGGFVFDSEFVPEGADAVISSPERLTLTASGILLLARCGHLPDLDRETIWDKSKADGIAKFLVCIQAGWMIFQTVGRVIYKTPVTLLEVNTLGHVFTALVIYILWWNKPKEVRSPTILEGAWTTYLVSYMFMSSRVSGRQPTGLISLAQWIKPELSELVWHPHLPPQDQPCPMKPYSFPIYNDVDRCSEAELGSLHHCARHNSTSSTTSTHSPQETGFLKPRPSHTITALPNSVITTQLSTSSSQSDPRFCARLHAASHAIRTYHPIRSLFHPSTHLAELQHLVTTTATNWPSDYYLPGLSGELMGMALWLSSSLYGGIHIAAWAEYFPTAAERLLWRFSATYIASSGAFWFVACVVGYRWPFASAWWDRFVELRAWKIEYAVLGLGAGVCGLAYIFARLFLVVDAVVSLRRLPVLAYDTPDWTTMFPHL